jgi:hypothetical protein
MENAWEDFVRTYPGLLPPCPATKKRKRDSMTGVGRENKSVCYSHTVRRPDLTLDCSVGRIGPQPLLQPQRRAPQQPWSQAQTQTRYLPVYPQHDASLQQQVQFENPFKPQNQHHQYELEQCQPWQPDLYPSPSPFELETELCAPQGTTFGKKLGLDYTGSQRDEPNLATTGAIDPRLLHVGLPRLPSPSYPFPRSRSSLSSTQDIARDLPPHSLESKRKADQLVRENSFEVITIAYENIKAMQKNAEKMQHAPSQALSFNHQFSRGKSTTETGKKLNPSRCLTAMTPSPLSLIFNSPTQNPFPDLLHDASFSAFLDEV